MNDEECIHGLGPVSACVICNGRARREAADLDNEPPTFIVTRYQAMCPECDEPIYPGDTIAWFPLHNRPTTHENCYRP
jgi:hypothetical protein